MIIGRIPIPESTPDKRGYRKKPRLGKKCANCGINPSRPKRTLCGACSSYQIKHKRPRPQSLIQKATEKRTKSKWCKICCGSASIQGDERCHACYQYKLRRGIERPHWLWDKDAVCLNCGFPQHAPLAPRFCAGRCNACWCYKKRTGNERPKALWGAGAYGWCDCGYPAEHVYDGFNLCNRCFGEAKK